MKRLGILLSCVGLAACAASGILADWQAPPPELPATNPQPAPTSTIPMPTILRDQELLAKTDWLLDDARQHIDVARATLGTVKAH